MPEKVMDEARRMLRQGLDPSPRHVFDCPKSCPRLLLALAGVSARDRRV